MKYQELEKLTTNQINTYILNLIKSKNISISQQNQRIWNKHHRVYTTVRRNFVQLFRTARTVFTLALRDRCCCLTSRWMSISRHGKNSYKANIEKRGYCKNAITLIDVKSKKAIRVALNPDFQKKGLSSKFVQLRR